MFDISAVKTFLAKAATHTYDEEALLQLAVEEFPSLNPESKWLKELVTQALDAAIYDGDDYDDREEPVSERAPEEDWTDWDVTLWDGLES